MSLEFVSKEIVVDRSFLCVDCQASFGEAILPHFQGKGVKLALLSFLVTRLSAVLTGLTKVLRNFTSVILNITP